MKLLQTRILGFFNNFMKPQKLTLYVQYHTHFFGVQFGQYFIEFCHCSAHLKSKYHHVMENLHVDSTVEA